MLVWAAVHRLAASLPGTRVWVEALNNPTGSAPHPGHATQAELQVGGQQGGSPPTQTLAPAPEITVPLLAPCGHRGPQARGVDGCSQLVVALLEQLMRSLNY